MQPASLVAEVSRQQNNMNIEAVVLKYCICESVCIQQVLGDGKRENPNAGSRHRFQLEGTDMPWNKSEMEIILLLTGGEVFFSILSQDGCSLLSFVSPSKRNLLV